MKKKAKARALVPHEILPSLDFQNNAHPGLSLNDLLVTNLAGWSSSLSFTASTLLPWFQSLSSLK